MRSLPYHRSMSDALRRTYDAFPYQSYPFPDSHPDRLATIAVLHGLAPTPLEHARILELGCASGGNLIPIAASVRGAQCVGIDFSEVQVREGRAVATALGLVNLELHAMDIMAVDARFGTFDYIVAHGVFSWVPGPVQEKLLAICAERLAPQGVAYVSFNVLPGWAGRGAVRAAMRYHTRQLTDPAARVREGRAILAFLATALAADDSAYAQTIRSEAEDMRDKADFYVLHEYLEEVNEPVYFHDFMTRATRHGLAYLGEAGFQHMQTTDLAPEAVAALAGMAPDLVAREQLLDFLRHRMFRQTLLVHDGAPVVREVAPARVQALRIAARAEPVKGAIDARSGVPETFAVPDGNAFTTADPLAKAALLLLARRWPQAIPFAELLGRAAEVAGVSGATDAGARLGTAALAGYAAGVLELHFAPSPFVLQPGAAPAAGALQRHQAARGDALTNLRHESMRIDDVSRAILVALTGERPRAAVAAAIWPALPPPARERLLDQALPQLARQALLVA